MRTCIHNYTRQCIDVLQEENNIHVDLFKNKYLAHDIEANYVDLPWHKKYYFEQVFINFMLVSLRI